MNCKKHFLLSFLFVISLATNAQFKKWDKMAGTSVGSALYNTGKADINVATIGDNTSLIKNYSVLINPSYGWFITDNSAIGFTLNINPNGQKTTYEQNGSTYQSDKSNGFNFGAGIFARTYFNNSGSLLPFVQTSFNAGASKLNTEGFFYGGSGPTAYKQTYTGKTTKGSFINTALTLGFTKMMGENAGLDFFLGYNYSINKNVFKKTTLRDDGNNGTIDTRGENLTTTKFTNHGFLLGVGFQIFLRKK